MRLLPTNVYYKMNSLHNFVFVLSTDFFAVSGKKKIPKWLLCADSHTVVALSLCIVYIYGNCRHKRDNYIVRRKKHIFSLELKLSANTIGFPVLVK